MNSQPQYRDKRLPESAVWTDINDLRWHFLFGGLFVPERPIDLDQQPSMGQNEPDLDPTPDTTQGGSTNIDEAGDTAGQGAYNPDQDGENDLDGDADSDSKPDHDLGEGDETSDQDDEFDDDFDDSDWGDDEFDREDMSDEEVEAEAQNDNQEEPPEVDPNEFDYQKPDTSKPELPGLEITASNGKTDYIRTFDSWTEFVLCASDESLRSWKHSHCAFDRDNDEYSGTSSMDQAVDMALWSGWPEGREMLIDSMATVIPKNEYRIHHELDVAGSFPIVPIYCAGDPACMMSIEYEQLHNSRPIVRIDYNNTCSHLISTKSMMNMGAAVLSFAQTLEMAGYSTELRIIGNTRNKNDNFRYNVVYKRAGEPFDLDKAAFAIAHPSVLRRFALGLMEQIPEISHFGPAGHGFPMRQPNDPTSGQPNGAIYIPPPFTNTNSVEDCKKIVETAAEHLIGQLTKTQEEAAD